MSVIRSCYLDNNATTRPRDEVIDAMEPIFRSAWGNPSSAHHYGRPLKNRIGEAREIVAQALGAHPTEIIFTSGGTESDNLAIKGFAWGNRKSGGGHIITSTIEHPAVLEPVRYLGKNGFSTSFVAVDGKGMVDPEQIAKLFRDNTILVSIMHANNEIGTILPVAQIATMACEKGIGVHTDAVQSFGKIPVDVKDLGVDLLSISGHKIHGPKGIGALYIKKGTKLHTLSHGGHHERGIRAGTENVAGIVGLGKAVELAMAERDAVAAQVEKLRDDLQQRIIATIPSVRINGDENHRLPGTLNVSIECVEGEALLINLDMAGIAISTGSACSSGSLDPSHVLMAMGIPHEIIHGSLRFSFGRESVTDDVDYVMSHLPRIVEMVRNISPLWDSVKKIPITLEDAAKNATTTATK